MEKTLVLIKPNVTKHNRIGEVIAAFEEKGVVIRALDLSSWSVEFAQGFYAVHRGKPFYDKLLEFMTSGPVVAMIVSHDNCISYVREIIGATDPRKAAPGTIRARFGESITFNAVHASDSGENAAKEISYVFGPDYLTG